MDLHQNFVDYLYSNYSSKKELTDTLVDILKIDRESVLRRLNNKVLFTAKEIGKIAEKLNISLDYMLSKNTDSIFLPLNLVMPHTIESVDDYFKLFSNDIQLLEKISIESPLHIGYIFDTLPINFYAPYEYLYKYICFKNMSFYIKTRFYEKYSHWQIPKELHDYKKLVTKCLDNCESIFYIWNNPVITNLIKDLNFSYKLKLIEKEEVQLIKKDIHLLLNNIVNRAQMVKKDINSITKPIDLYILNINITFSCVYVHSKANTLLQFRTPFPYSKLCRNTKEFYTVYNWMNSMKKLSTLVSDSGIVERNLFFEEQHEIVDRI